MPMVMEAIDKMSADEHVRTIHCEIEDGVVQVYGVLGDRRDPYWSASHLAGTR